MTLAGRCVAATNRVAASDVVASIVWAYGGFDYSGLELRDGHFIALDLSRGRVQNLHLKECIINHLTFPHEQPDKLTVQNCLIQHVYGIASKKGLPEWVLNCEFETFESIQNVSRIRLLGLTPSQEILVAIIRKTFFQRGAGRKEEALKRGLGELGRLGLSDRVLNCLITNEIIGKFKGDEGWVYTPNRSQTSRMDKMMAELVLSHDVIWTAVSQLS